jgi:hypothetical protein
MFSRSQSKGVLGKKHPLLPFQSGAQTDWFVFRFDDSLSWHHAVQAPQP